jgi:hypothetical protein
MAQTIENPNAVSLAGRRIYDERYRAEYEAKCKGQFVAIDILEGSATLGATADEALAKAESLHPNGFFHVIRVGHRSAFHVGVRS